MYTQTLASLTPTYNANGEVVSTLAAWSVDNTIRQQDVTTLVVSYEVGQGSGVIETQQVALNPQVKAEFALEVATVETTVQAAEVATSGSAIFAIVQVLLTDGALKWLWGLVNASQLISFVVLLKFPVPSNVQPVFDFLTLANGDFAFLQSLPNVFRERHIVDYAALQRQSPLNSNFAAAGFESASFFLAYELKFVLLLFYLGLLLLLVLTAVAIRNKPRW